ncbi:MAG: HPP family protein [Chloroflexota bacterium]
MVNGFVAIAILAAVAGLTGQPFMFARTDGVPAVLHTPLAAARSPATRSLAIGRGGRRLALVLLGLADAGSAMTEGFSTSRIVAAALSLGLTSGVMVWLGVPHPPAGATTLIVSLGILAEPEQLLVLMLAVLALVGQAMVIDRLAGIPYPLWAPRTPRPPP